MTRARVVGGVLAGGQSRRMGRDKAGVFLDDKTGETLGARAVRTLREVCDEVWVLGHGRALDDALPRLPDALVDGGPAGGLLALVESGRGDVYIAVPVDMPRLRAGDLTRLLDVVSPHGLALAASYELDGTRAPLPCAIAAAGATRLAGTVARGARGLGTILESLEAATLPGAADFLRNINDSSDLESLTGPVRPG